MSFIFHTRIISRHLIVIMTSGDYSFPCYEVFFDVRSLSVYHFFSTLFLNTLYETLVSFKATDQPHCALHYGNLRACIRLHLCFERIFVCLFVCLFLVGPISTAAMKAYCTLSPLEFRHSSPEARHTKRRERPLLAKDGTKTKEI
jgi:hypothetical protein